MSERGKSSIGFKPKTSPSARVGRLQRLRNRIQIFAFPYKPDFASGPMLPPKCKKGVCRYGQEGRRDHR